MTQEMKKKMDEGSSMERAILSEIERCEWEIDGLQVTMENDMTCLRNETTKVGIESVDTDCILARAKRLHESREALRKVNERRDMLCFLLKKASLDAAQNGKEA